MSYNLDKCYVCNNANASNITVLTYSDRKYTSCKDCFINIRECIIPIKEFEYGIILNYEYFDVDINLNENNFLFKYIQHNNHTEKVLLSSVINHHIEVLPKLNNLIKISDIDFYNSDFELYSDIDMLVNKIESREYQITVPIFFTRKFRHRNYAEIDMYDFIKLYQENNNIGFYQIDILKYQGCDQNMLYRINLLNNIFFKIMLRYNKLAKFILKISNNTMNNYLSLLPEDIIYMIIKLIGKK